MKYCLSNTGEPFQFTVRAAAVYSFGLEEPTAVSDGDYEFIINRIGSQSLKLVDTPTQEPAPIVDEQPLKDEE